MPRWRPPSGTTTCVIHYLKPYACNAVLFKRNPPLEITGKIFVNADPELVGPSGLGTTCQSVDQPDTPRCQQSPVDDQRRSGRERAQLVIKKVAKPVGRLRGKSFRRPALLQLSFTERAQLFHARTIDS